MTWFVVRSATRQEKRAAASLVELFGSDAVYLPLEARWVRHARQKTRATYPLFAGYLFVQIEPDDVWLALGADGVHNILGVERQTVTVEPDKLTALREAEARGDFDATLNDPLAKTFKPGEKLRVVEGPFAGWIGEVARMRGKNRVGLLTHMFGIKREIELPVGSLAAA